MKLYTTPTSAYGRMARIVIIEKGLEARVPVEGAQTRTENSPYYAVNPSGRVPFLELDDGTGLEDSSLVCAYLDGLDGRPSLGAEGLEAKRMEASARSFLDGLSVWVREYLYRPPELRSDFIIDHERARSRRLCDLFEGEVQGPVFSGPLNMAQITLACALLGRPGSPPGFDWRDGRDHLSAWAGRIAKRPSLVATAPAPDPH